MHDSLGLNIFIYINGESGAMILAAHRCGKPAAGAEHPQKDQGSWTVYPGTPGEGAAPSQRGCSGSSDPSSLGLVLSSN